MQGVQAHQLGEFEVVDDPVGLLQRLVELLAGARHLDAPPELLPQPRDQFERLAQARVRTGHAAELPHDLAEFAVEGVGGAVTVHGQQQVEPVLGVGDGLLHGGV